MGGGRLHDWIRPTISGNQGSSSRSTRRGIPVTRGTFETPQHLLMMSPSATRDIVRLTPYLRRYARALLGSQRPGDDLVQAALESLANSTGGMGRNLPMNVWLFRAFHRVWRRSLDGHSIDTHNRSVVDNRLGRLSPEHRSALLLVAMEGFTEAETAQILELSEETVEQRFVAAAHDIETQLTTDVLIIEDEPSGGRDCLDRDRRWLGGIAAGCVSPGLARHAGRA